MYSDGDMRQPYGPGWEDADWTPQASPASEPDRVSAVTLHDYMESLRRVAGPLAATNAKHFEAKSKRHPARGSRVPAAVALAGQTRRWVVASGASLLAVGTFALPRPARAPEAAPTRAPSSVATPGAAVPRLDDEVPLKKR